MMKFIYKITFLFLLFPLITSANSVGKKQEKSKVITKEYKVNANAKVAIDNRYGNLDITTWDKKQVEIEVTITVKGDNLESLENKLASIDVEFETSSNFISAKTIFEKQQKSGWSFWKKNNNVSYKVNYKVKMPKTNTVDLDNDYGSIFLGDLSGKADINCDYGKIIVGELSASNNNINLDYCSSSTISYMKSGNVNVDYSKITIDEAEDLKVNEDYSTIKFGKVKDINFNADYGSVTIDEAVNVDGNSDYASMRIGTIYKNLTLETDYGSVSVKRLAKGFENVTIDGQYAGIKIGVDEGAIFDFVLDLQYAGFKYDDDQIEFFKKISKSTKKYYEGKFGKGNSSGRIKIRSQYGGVSIKENY
ncbi:hypothetical protein BW723_16865 [Polaribacter reichenbachii]|nr:hypothetical protein [Polaribacter reichenbachii]APZ47862.1 hypothetical protein BW723_16865 [Polaribacter reichenbachii]AUC18496.1 hypothetical protein BTO17_07260 [Polaribacter reichenbachii]